MEAITQERIERTVNIDEERDLLVAQILLDQNPKSNMTTKLSRNEAIKKINNYD